MHTRLCRVDVSLKLGIVISKAWWRTFVFVFVSHSLTVFVTDLSL